jgi:hypothetical protein
VQLLVHDGQQLLRRTDVAGLGSTQQFRNVLDRLGVYGFGIREKKLALLPRNSRLKE